MNLRLNQSAFIVLLVMSQIAPFSPSQATVLDRRIGDDGVESNSGEVFFGETDRCDRLDLRMFTEI